MPIAAILVSAETSSKIGAVASNAATATICIGALAWPHDAAILRCERSLATHVQDGLPSVSGAL
jgi:hypothetical protein